MKDIKMRRMLCLIMSLFMSVTMLYAGGINLDKGWNLLSVGKNSDLNTSCLLNNLSSYNPKVWSYNNNNKSWIDENTVKGIIGNHGGFWLDINRSVDNFDMTTCQKNVDDSNITLYSGWNLMSVGENTDGSAIISNFINTALLWQYDSKNKKWFALSNEQSITNKINENRISFISNLGENDAFWVYNYGETYKLSISHDIPDSSLPTSGGVPNIVAYTPKYKVIISPVVNESFLVGTEKSYYFKIENYDGTLLDDLDVKSVVIESMDRDKLLFNDNSKLKVYNSNSYHTFNLKSLRGGEGSIKISVTIEDSKDGEVEVDGIKDLQILQKEQLFNNSYDIVQDISNASLKVNTAKTYFYQITDKNGNQVDDSKVASVTVKTLDESRIAFKDGANKKMFTSKAYQTFNLKTNDINGTAKLEITVNMNDGSAKTIELDINVTLVSTLSATKIIFDPDSFTVKNGTAQKISISTFDINNIPVSTTVKINQLIDSNNKIFGTLDSYSITTDANGKGTVVYTPPTNIEQFGGTSKNINFTIKDNNISKLLSIKFSQIDKVYKVVLSTNKIDVTNGLRQAITVYTLNSNNKPISATINIPAPYDTALEKMLGSFSSATLTTNAMGEGTFYYTSPSPFDNTLDIEHNVTISDVTTGKDAILSLDFTPVQTETNATSYNISLNAGDSFVVNNKNSMIVNIVRSEDQSVKIDPKDIHSISITSQNHLLSFSKNNDNNFSATFKNNYNIFVYTGKVAGVDILDISANIFDGEKNITINKNIPITVSSGPTHSISIIYLKSDYNANNGLYEDTYTIHAVDKFGNPVKKGTKIYAGVVNGLDKNSLNDTYLFVNKNGSIYYNSDLSETDFNISNAYALDNVQDSDILVVLANEDRLDSKYLGGWNIKNIDKNNNQLILKSIYGGDTTNKLTFAVGNEKRYNRYDHSLALADIDSADKMYTIGDNGTTLLKLRYDPYLVGKNVFLYANSQSNERVGIAIRRLLSGTGISSTSYTCSGGDGGKTCDVKLSLTMNDRDEPVRFITVGGFEYDGCTLSSIDNTNTQRDGVVELHVTAPAKESCNVTWDNSIISEYPLM